jgi:C-terminal processing protease CtpA/Prc
VLMHVIGDFVTPSGVRLEGEGVVPDQPVALSVQSLREGRDATLEAALAWVDTWLAGRARRGLP